MVMDKTQILRAVDRARDDVPLRRRFVRTINEECLDRLVPIGKGISDGPCNSVSPTTTTSGTTEVSRTP